MRELRIVGVDAGASTVECETGDGADRFVLALDDRFRAAARGEYVGPERRDSRPAALRPREIQDRIRHGASPEEVAAEAGVPLSRIDGFAHPVMLERATAADKARRAHPVLSDGPAVDTLDDRVLAALEARGIDRVLVRWDAWRAKDGSWRVQVSWPAGLSEDATARWSYQADSHGGTARPLDEAAEALVDPSRAARLHSVATRANMPEVSGERPLRSAPPVRAVAPPTPRALPDVPAPTPAEHRPAAIAPTRRDDRTTESGAPHVPAPATPATAPRAPEHPVPRPGGSGPVTVPVSVPVPATSPHPAPRTDADRPVEPSTDVETTDGTVADPVDPAVSEHASAPEHTADGEDFLRHPPAESPRRATRRHPAMPSWEDVLLGVRGKDD